AVGEVEPRGVWQQDVREVERRPSRAGFPERGHEAVEVVDAAEVEGAQVDLRERARVTRRRDGGLVARIAAEVPPRLVDHRQALLELWRRDRVQVDGARVRVERRQVRAFLLAEALLAELG